VSSVAWNVTPHKPFGVFVVLGISPEETTDGLPNLRGSKGEREPFHTSLLENWHYTLAINAGIFGAEAAHVQADPTGSPVRGWFARRNGREARGRAR
jgi:hypothetical protein